MNEIFGEKLSAAKIKYVLFIVHEIAENLEKVITDIKIYVTGVKEEFFGVKEKFSEKGLDVEAKLYKVKENFKTEMEKKINKKIKSLKNSW